jgi:23S rRNA (adenine2030-N6)-methyltransferase
VNYRHAFHAGNFADLVKHAALLRLLDRLTEDPAPLRIVDTHAGAGLYDLTDVEQARSREAEAGVARLMAGKAPPVFAGLVAAVRARNPGRGVSLYPGSPSLVLDRLRRGDRYIGCELRADDHARLERLLAASGKSAEARHADGYATAVAIANDPGRLFVLIDPPFERADDYTRLAETLAAVNARRPEAVVLVWLPLKDLETLDGFVRRLESKEGPPGFVAEARLRPLHDPMKMNGCALVALNPPRGYADEVEAICGFVVEALGDKGGAAKVWPLGT